MFRHFVFRIWFSLVERIMGCWSDILQWCEVNAYCGTFLVGSNVDAGLFDETFLGIPLIDR